MITDQCGILSKLLPGDFILADQGFNIFELVAECNAQAKLPAFTKGKAQPSAKKSMNPGNWLIQIHVKRLIGMVKQTYGILVGVLPVSFIKNDSTCDVL